MDQHDEFNADAFFNDGSLQPIDPNVELGALGVVPQNNSPAVLAKLLESREGGLVQRVSWSRHSHLACISEDGMTVSIYCLNYLTHARTWALTSPYPLDVVFEDAVIVAWGPSGNDLAVATARGKVTVLQLTTTCLNRLTEAYSYSPELLDGLTQPIAFMWLNQERQDRQKSVVLRTSKINGKWTQVQVRARLLGPVWQRALAQVHRNGNLSLLYQRPDMSWSHVMIALQPSGEVFTHAAISSTLEGKFLVALHSTGGMLSAMYVQVEWPEINQILEHPPRLSLEVIGSFVPSPVSTSTINGQVYDPGAWFLTDLSITPPAHVESIGSLPATITTIYTCRNRSVPIGQPGHFVSGLIRRWTLTQLEQKLHPRFAELFSKGSSKDSTTQETVLQRQPDRDDQVILGFQPVDGGQNVMMVTQDGRIDCLGTDDLTSLTYRGTIVEVIAMIQAGFGFPTIDPSVNLSFSPNTSVLAEVGRTGKPQIRTLQYHNQVTGEPNDPTMEAAIASVVLAFARACWSGPNIDDIVTCILEAFGAHQLPQIVAALYHVLFRETEFINEKVTGSEVEKVVQKPTLIKVLSFHAALSLVPRPLGASPAASNFEERIVARTVSGQWVWLATNLRYVVTVLFVNSREIGTANASMSQEVIDLICQNVKWALDLFRWMASVILQVGDRMTNPEFFTSDDKDNSIPSYDGQVLVSLLLNSHWSRTLMIAISKALKMYARPPEQRSAQQTQIVRTIHQYSTGKGMTLMAIDSILDPRRYAIGETDGDHAGTAARQIEMMATGILPEMYQGLIMRLLTTLFNHPGGLRDKNQIDRMKLFVEPWDMDWIFMGCAGDIVPRRRRPPVIYDIHRKRPIVRGVVENVQHGSGNPEPMIRRCVRCASYNEDVNPVGKDWPRFMSVYLTRCVCDGHWLIVPWNNPQGDE